MTMAECLSVMQQSLQEKMAKKVSAADGAMRKQSRIMEYKGGMMQQSNMSDSSVSCNAGMQTEPQC
jgi:hypothetical protein